MNYAERILAIARGNNGVVTTAQVAAAGILRGHLKVLGACGTGGICSSHGMG